MSQSHQASMPSPLRALTANRGACGLRSSSVLVYLSMSKSKAGATSTLLSSCAPACWKMPGYLMGLSSPSGTERIMMDRFSPRSKSTGQTRLPTFSIKMTSMFSRPTAWSKASTASMIMLPSRWHRPPVLIWMAGMPASFMVMASTSEAISPSITAQRRLALSRRRSLVPRIVVVLPEPGLDSTLIT